MNTSLKIALVLAGRPAWAVARDADISPNRISAFVKGRALPRPDELDRLATVLDLPPDALFPDLKATAGVA